ncbi:CubicO group peptidase (beta-lactamase class C family) [Epilithonimonas hungarica]|uniref:serine hydrolase domain-containing protein n=1 Tax=Epilithonimonas hungarica TaxID=454006 RepID=UPI002789F082|nr:serine hydrolase domain-containing protein [Epilithonimonas hungarica]MDP9955034.1 CubicO group peptidase (beta-lactamase class C family) [Epilithonimonas hungarica]
MITRFLIVMLSSILNIVYGQKIDEAKLQGLLKKAEDTHSEAVIIYQDNQLVAEKYFGIGNPDVKIEAMSCTKSIVGLSVACLLTDGLIKSLDTPIADFYPEWKQGQKQLITIRHLVNMTSGMQNNPNASVEIYPSDNFVQLALAAELSKKPGEAFEYNNKSLNLMAGVIMKITGKRMDEYIGQRLFKPLEITDYSWTLDNAGNPHVMSGCQIKPKDLIKLGLLLLNDGYYNNNQVIAKEHIAEVVAPSAQYKGYGMLWWLDYENTISTVDNEIINDLKKANIAKEFIRKVIRMKGIYRSNEDFSAKLQTVFGHNPYEYISHHLKHGLRLRKRDFSGSVIYRADGYLGNYIIVNPKHNIVAIRMISHQSFKGDKDSFSDFARDLVNLTP